MSKKRKLGNQADDYLNEKDAAPFSTYDDEVFDLLEDEGTTVASDEIPIMNIFADPLQPRNIFPREIIPIRDGDPTLMPQRLQQWAELLYDSGNDMPINKLLLGQAEPSQYMTGDKSVDAFIELLTLASQIRAVGLNQRIGVRPSSGERFTIIFGERRWTAFHILNHFLPGEDHSTIPAKVADVSPWQIVAMQVGENTQRKNTNAIGKAREFARLLIVARQDEFDYDPPHNLNAPDCDRPYYAQVSNGNIHRIPRGMGAQFEQVLGISTGQMRRYRQLLAMTGDYEVDNKFWNLGDDHDWAEYFMREIYENLEVDTIKEILYTVPTGTVSQLEDTFRDAIESAKNAAKLAAKQKQNSESPLLNRWVETTHGIGQVIEQQGRRLLLQDINDNVFNAQDYEIIDLDVPIPDPSAEQVSPYEVGGDLEGGSDNDNDLSQDNPSLAANFFSIGQHVKTASGIRGTIAALIGEWVEIDRNDRKTFHRSYHHSDLTLDNAPRTEEDQVKIREGSADNSSSPTPRNPGEILAAQWVGKPALYQGEPCIVLQIKKGMPGYVVIQLGKERHTIEAALLKSHDAPPEQTLQDFMGNQSSPSPQSGDAFREGKQPQHLITGDAKPFVTSITLLAATHGLQHNDIVSLLRTRQGELDAEEVAAALELAYQQVETIANHIKDYTKAVFEDIASEATHGD